MAWINDFLVVTKSMGCFMKKFANPVNSITVEDVVNLDVIM
jgi:hypothetical protein